MLEIKNLSKSFGGNIVCDGINLKLEPGRILCLIGNNGSGKTTLLNLLTGNIFSDSGKIFWNGQDITTMPSYKRSRLGFSRSYQWPRLFEEWTVESIFEFVCSLNSSNSSKKTINKLIELFKLKNILSKNINHLALGQKKLLDLAISFTNHPHLLLLDEPCAGLFAEQFHLVSNAMLWFRDSFNSCIIVVDHNYDFIEKINISKYSSSVEMSGGKLMDISSINE